MDRHLKRPWAISVALAVLGIGWTCGAAFGQPFGFRGDVNEGTLIQAPREVQRLVEQATQSIQREAWTEATLAVGMLLGIESQTPRGDIGQQDFFLPMKGGAKEQNSIRDSAMRLMEDIPEAGMKVFELRYGVEAEQLLKDATQKGDWAAIEKIARDYGPTISGREAAWLVAESKIASGQPLEAAIWLSRLMRQRRAQQQFGFGGAVLAAACWKASGEPKQAEKILESAKDWFASAKATWQGKSLSSDMPIDNLLSAIELNELVESTRQEKATRWTGGSSNRNGDFPAGVPLPLVNWTFQLHESDQHGLAALKTIKQKSVDRNALLIPSRSPLVVPPWVIAMSYDQRIYGIHMRTGKLMWTDNTSHIPVDVRNDRGQFRELPTNELPILDYLARRVWGEAALGQPTSDGRNIYSLSELPSSHVSDQHINGGNAFVLQPRGKSGFNVLHAWSIPQEGKIVWEVGGDTGLMEPDLAGVLFLGPPMEHEGKLYILGEFNGEVYLFCLSPDSGALQWKQQLVANQTAQLVNDQIRRNMACSPAIAEGQIVCPTLSGQLVCLDLGTRNLRWSHRYELSNEAIAGNQFNQWGVGMSGEVNPLKFRSTESSVVISGACVIHAPPESTVVYALDLLTGRRLWELNRSNTLFVGGVWNDRVLLTQDQAVNCFNIKDGKSVWSEPLALSSIGRVAGRGVRNGNSYFLPLSNNEVNEIIEIDFETGEIVDRMRVNQTLGNLAATADQLISLSAVELSAYSIRDQIRSEIDLEFAHEKNSTGRLQREAKIRLAEGKLAESLDLVEAAYRINRDDPEVRLLLKDITLMAMKQDFQKFAPRVAEYEEIISLGSDRSLYLVSIIVGLQREKAYLSGFRKLLEFTDMVSDSFGMGSPIPESIEPEVNLQVRQDIWTSSKLAQFFESMNASDRDAASQQLKTQIDALTKSRTSRDYGLRSDLFRWLPSGQAIRLSDAKKYSKDREWILSEDTLEEVVEVSNWEKSGFGEAFNNESKSPPAQDSDGQVVEISQLRLELMALADRWTAVSKLAEPSKLSIEEAFNKLSEQRAKDPFSELFGQLPHSSITPTSLKRFSEGLSGWPAGQPSVSASSVDHPLQSIAGGESCPVKQTIGVALQDWNVTRFAGSLVLTNPTGTQRLSVQLDLSQEMSGPPSVYFLDSLALIETANELIAVDTLRASKADNSMFEQTANCIIWRETFGKGRSDQPHTGVSYDTKPWGEKRIKNRKGFAVGAVGRMGVFVVANNGTTLVALDPRTGSPRWTRTNLGGESQSLPTIALEQMRLAVLNQSQSTRLILDARDGSLIEKSEWLDKVDVWCSSGRHVLAAVVNRRDEANMIRFKILDALTGKVVREASLAPGVVADVCQQERFVALTKQGELTFWDLRTGEEAKHTLELPTNTTLKALALERFGDRLLLISDGPSFDVEGTSKVRGSDNARLCRGPMIALDLANGKPLWDKPRTIYHYLLPVNQLRITPVITLERQFRFKVSNITTESASIALLDLRDGRLLFADDYLDGARDGLGFHCRADLEKPELVIQRGNSNIQVRWDDKDPPPTSSAESTEIGKITKAELESRVPKEFVERLQSGMPPVDGSIPDDIFDFSRRREKR
jgi:outer membrane protein assembly factor BamB